MGAINAGRTLVLRAVGAELSRAGVSRTNDVVGSPEVVGTVPAAQDGGTVPCYDREVVVAINAAHTPSAE